MKLTNSLRYRLVAGIMSLVLVICIIFAWGLSLAFDGAEQRLFGDHIRMDVDSFMEQYSINPDVINLPRRNFQVYVSDKGDKSDLPDFLSNDPADEEITVGTHDYHVITRKAGDRSFYFVFDDSSFESFENSIFASEVVIALTLCLAAILLGLSIAKLIIGPVTSLARRVGTLEEPVVDVHTDKVRTFNEIEVLENAFESYQRRIARFLKREQEFSADASHELRTPLMAVRSAAENLRHERDSDSRVQELTSRIIRSCDQMTSVTEALLLLARETAIPEEKLEVVDVGDYLREQIELLGPMLKARHITVEIDEREPLNLRAYKVGLHIVTGNILKNAVQHSCSDRIRITLSDDALEIEDFGRGIPEEVQAGLFERKTRDASGDEGRNGLGLALAKRFCDELGWDLELDSVPGYGTRIRLEFGHATVPAEPA